MNSIVNYIVESFVALGILTFYYLLVLRNNNQLQFKRLYLVVSIVFSAILPLANFQVFGGSGNGNTTPVYNVLETVTVFAGDFSEQTIPIIKSHNWLVYFYLCGFFLFAVRMLTGLVRIGLMRSLFQSVKRNQFRLFITEGNFRPFSFFRWIFVPQKIIENGTGDIILTHEQEHARQWHSVDIMLLEMALIVQWFNPFIWILRREIKDNHEFMTDRAVLHSGVSKADYMQSMLYEMLGTKFGIANNFSLSITQKRIKMMKSNKIKKYVFGKAALASILLVGLFFVFACEVETINGQNSDEGEILILEDEKEESYSLLNIDDEQVFIVVEEMPHFSGGDTALMRFLREEIKYPQKAQDNGIQGRVYVSFVVARDGTIRDVKINRGVDLILDEEAMRVVKAMPDWIAGKQRGIKVNVKYMVPINFVLSESSVKKEALNKNKELLHIWLTGNQVKLSTHKSSFTIDEGIGKIVQKLESQHTLSILLFADNIDKGRKLLQTIKNKKGSDYSVNNELNNVVFKTRAKSKEKAQKEYEELSKMVEEYIQNHNVQNAGEQLNITSSNDKGFVFIAINANPNTIALNKKLEAYTKEDSGEISYVFTRTFNKKES